MTNSSRRRDAEEILIDYEFNAFDRWNAASWVFKGLMTKEEAIAKLRVC